METIEPGNPEDALIYLFAPAVAREELVALRQGIDAFLASAHQHRLTFLVGLFEGTPFLVDDALVRRQLPAMKSRKEMLGSGVFFALPIAEFARATAGATPLTP